MKVLYAVILFVGCSLSFINSSESKIWALLVAGSSGYGNYRHQADVCHAYQILRHQGIPAENIITMMADDIAYNPENPTPGVIINQPRGKNVYSEVIKDYTNTTVTPKNFINVLTGNKNAMKNIGSGRVIESGPEDIVFVNFVDHGGSGILCFPAEDLTVKKLNDALSQMAAENKFKKLILYVEACHAGSMFDNILPDDQNIFVMTAADPNESSYACYFDEKVGAYLGDVFSVNWMQESEKENLKNHSLNHIFEIVRTQTEPKSHVEEYGDLDIGSTTISDVLGSPEVAGNSGSYDTYIQNPGSDAVDSLEVPVQMLLKKLRKLERTNSGSEAALLRGQIRSLYEKRHLVENVMDELVLRLARNNLRRTMQLKSMTPSINKENIDCYDVVVEKFSKTCFNIAQNPFVLRHLNVLVNACTLFNHNENKIIRDMENVCGKLQKMTGIV